jgi:hypothetical protein
MKKQSMASQRNFSTPARVCECGATLSQTFSVGCLVGMDMIIPVTYETGLHSFSW